MPSSVSGRSLSPCVMMTGATDSDNIRRMLLWTMSYCALSCTTWSNCDGATISWPLRLMRATA